MTDLCDDCGKPVGSVIRGNGLIIRVTRSCFRKNSVPYSHLPS